MTDRPDEDAIARLLGDPERQAEARAALRDALDARPATMSYMSWRRRLPAAATRRLVAILCSFTIETIAPFLEVEAYLSGWRAAPAFAQYGAWRNVLFDGDMPGEIEPEACALLLHAAELLPEGGAVDDALGLLESGVRAFRAARGTPLLLGLLADPPAPHALALGPTPARRRAAAVARLNARIAELAAELPDVHVLDVPAWLAAVGDGWYDPAGFLSSLSLVSHKAMPALARGLARTMGCLYRPRRKLLAVDLDNSLWGGIVGEDGVDGLALGEDWPGPAYLAFQRFLRELRASGVLLTVVSKNEEADARAVFDSRPEMVLGWDDFSGHRVNWRDKASNLVEIAEELGLGLDSFVFADDSPMECALIRETLPMVEVVELGKDPAGFGERILRTQAFDTLVVSEADSKRAGSYLAERRRKSLRETVKDYESFLAGIDLRLRIRRAEPGSVERIHQLLGRTNQFHLSLERPSLEAVRGLALSGAELYSAELVDRFGDYGIIGVVQLQPQEDGLEIRNLAISCRALGRRVEDALLGFCSDVAARQGKPALLARFRKGPRNMQVTTVLERHGFGVLRDDAETTDYARDLRRQRIAWPRHIDVEVPEERRTAS